MRITNKIMQDNSLYNINSNKVSQNNLSTQMSTQKKINRPSDDPVVAIRSLRLRSSVSQISQYYEKNVPDAESWIKVTEDALSTVTEVVTDLVKQATKGANSDLKSDDLDIIIQNMEALEEEVYSTGNVDYAGRFVFTGYRTDTPLTFMKNEEISYSITEQLYADSIDTVSYVETDDLSKVNETNYDTFTGLEESSISRANFHRIRLAYSGCDSTVVPSITFMEGGVQKTLTADVVNSYEEPNPYQSLESSTNGIVFSADTGELLISDAVYERLNALTDNTATDLNETEFQITYTKSDWKTGDLNPQHYFACEAEGIQYNQEYLTGTVEKQVISYDVGYNQTIEVNTTADKVFTHDAKREVEDLRNGLTKIQNMEKIICNYENIIAKTTDEDDKATLQKQLDAANKALEYMKDDLQLELEHAITNFQAYLDQANLAVTDNGTAGSRLALVKTRLMSQQTTFETLQSENEDADMTEVAIKLQSASVTYDAALIIFLLKTFVFQEEPFHDQEMESQDPVPFRRYGAPGLSVSSGLLYAGARKALPCDVHV